MIDKEMKVMEFRKAKKVVIIGELTILEDVIKTITKLGAEGYTIMHGPTGKGKTGVRSGESVLGKLLANVRIDTITNEERAKKIAAEVEEKVLRKHIGIVYLQDVEVIQAKLCE